MKFRLKRGYLTMKSSHIKIIFAGMMFAFTLTFMSANVAAERPNAGYTLYTDIIASINQYNITSYNIDGYTAVVAEDLRDYGFDVEWKPDERALYITRNNSNTIASTYIAPIIPKSQVGKRACDVLNTDIKTYINGDLVTSYNIDGRTIIYFADLDVFGEVVYSDETRTLQLSVLDGLQYKLGNPLDNDLYFTKNSVNGLCFYINAVNNTNKTIKYFNVDFFMFNSVLDPAYDTRGSDVFRMRIIGPMYPGERIANAGPDYGVDTYNDNLCYYAGVTSVFIEYMDNTSETVQYVDLGKEKTQQDALPDTYRF